ncbi:MAG: carboxypeptidase regulatory-like domain-containing protein [Bryobacteraceae bacterium]
MSRVVLAAVFAVAIAYAQQDMGVITGLVTDASGAAVAGGSVTATNLDTAETRQVSTSETGAYTIGPLRIGRYSVAVELAGFKRAVFPELRLSAQDRARVDLRLEVGEVTESVSVTAEIPVLQAETSNLAHVVSQKEMRELPLNGRNFQQLAWTSAGIMPSTRSRDRESGFNANGQRMTQNSFLIDGIDNNNNVMGMQDRKMQVVVPSLDAVAEFKIQTSNYSAEFGRNSGAVMIVSIKSGTNQFHGTAYEYLRNDATDARDAFTYVDRTGDGRADPEVLKQNQFGATFGGPIIRNRTFFFGSWEGRRERRSQSDSAIVPTADERNGIFNSALVTVRDPATGQAFPGNRIPASRFDPVADKLRTIWPDPNFSGLGTRSNFISGPAWNTTRDAIDARVDHSFSDKDKIFGRFSYSRFDNLRQSVFPEPARGAQGNDRALDDNDARSLAVSYTRVVSSTLINEFRYGLSRQKVDKRELTDVPMDTLNQQFGIRGIPGSDRLFGLPRFTLSGSLGFEGLGQPGSMPNFKVAQVHQFLDNVSWNRGSHNFKFGLDVRRNQNDIFGGGSGHGSFTFDGQFTRISFGDFLLGMPSAANLTTLLLGDQRFKENMFYALDDWKITSRLTLNLGIRYELNSPWFDKNDRMNKLELGAVSGFNSIVTAGDCGGSWSCRGLVNTDTNNFAPRLGFAWQANAGTVVRAGTGIFYGGQGALGANGRMINNWPYNQSVTAQSTAARPALNLRDGFPQDFLGLSRTTPPANLNWTIWEQNFPTPTVYQWNVAIQRELARNLSLTTAYVGSSSNFIQDSYNWNGSAPGPPATERQRRRIPEWNNINLATPYGHSSYHGLNVQLERRYAAGFYFTAGYTWGHSIDNIAEQFGPGGGGLMDFRNFDSSRGNSNFDVRHRWVFSSVYELPFGKGKRWASGGGVLNQLFGGWQLTSLWSMQTGNYFTITVPNARQRLGATGIGNWWPDRVRDPKLDNRTADRWFDTSAFVSPRAADGSWYLGNAGRAILNEDGLFNLDFGLMKRFAITERMGLQFRWETFNVTNTPSLGTPNTNLESPDFGRVRSTVSLPRQMQFALRLDF